MNNKDADETLDIHKLIGTFGVNCLYEILGLNVSMEMSTLRCPKERTKSKIGGDVRAV